MKYIKRGEHNLKYVAVDNCGNRTEQIRKVIVGATATVLRKDGTLIINELPESVGLNEKKHGVVNAMFLPGPYTFVNQSDIPWFEQKSFITSVKFGSIVKQTSCKRLFNSLQFAENIDLTNLDTSECTDMSQMFSGCIRLANVNTALINTANVTDMQMMFFDCQQLSNLDLSSFNTSKVTNMQQMFRYNKRLKTIFASKNFATSQVTSSNNMFAGCVALVGAIPYDDSVVDKTNANLQGYFTAK